jgi:hypothetical protein
MSYLRVPPVVPLVWSQISPLCLLTLTVVQALFHLLYGMAVKFDLLLWIQILNLI